MIAKYLNSSKGQSWLASLFLLLTVFFFYEVTISHGWWARAWSFGVGVSAYLFVERMATYAGMVTVKAIEKALIEKQKESTR
jgi:hypothetical protein